ncbi:cytosol aminopeptidase, partial [Helicosporidium sp. ATCC 50920]
APDRFELRVLEEEDCLARDMGCYLGVTSGAGTPPKLIHLVYTGAAEAGADLVELALVGKGVTFDSGGYNLKTGPGCMIESMKLDMGGAGAVLGVARALADLRPAGVKVHLVTAACENMVDAKAVRPGDVLVASNGKTVEVINTDAEGRLTLCDAMVYVQREAPKLHCLLDVATLTGACMVALGTRVGGAYSNRDEVREGFCRLAREAGERFWPLPLENAYADELKSQIADLKNVGTRLAGSINGALFLHEFLERKDLPWIHLDVAGPVMDHKTGGATGYPTAALLHWILNFKP